MKRRLLHVALLAPLALGGCGGSGGSSSAPGSTVAGRPYARAVQAEVLRSCEAAAGGAGGAVASCRCALRYLEAHVPQRTLEATEQAILKGEARVPPAVREAGRVCHER